MSSSPSISSVPGGRQHALQQLEQHHDQQGQQQPQQHLQQHQQDQRQQQQQQEQQQLLQQQQQQQQAAPSPPADPARLAEQLAELNVTGQQPQQGAAAKNLPQSPTAAAEPKASPAVQPAAKGGHASPAAHARGPTAAAAGGAAADAAPAGADAVSANAAAAGAGTAFAAAADADAAHVAAAVGADAEAAADKKNAKVAARDANAAGAAVEDTGAADAAAADVDADGVAAADAGAADPAAADADAADVGAAGASDVAAADADIAAAAAADAGAAAAQGPTMGPYDAATFGFGYRVVPLEDRLDERPIPSVAPPMSLAELERCALFELLKELPAGRHVVDPSTISGRSQALAVQQCLLYHQTAKFLVTKLDHRRALQQEAQTAADAAQMRLQQVRTQAQAIWDEEQAAAVDADADECDAEFQGWREVLPADAQAAGVPEPPDVQAARQAADRAAATAARAAAAVAAAEAVVDNARAAADQAERAFPWFGVRQYSTLRLWDLVRPQQSPNSLRVQQGTGSFANVTPGSMDGGPVAIKTYNMQQFGAETMFMREVQLQVGDTHGLIALSCRMCHSTWLLACMLCYIHHAFKRLSGVGCCGVNPVSTACVW